MARNNIFPFEKNSLVTVLVFYNIESKSENQPKTPPTTSNSYNISRLLLHCLLLFATNF